MNKNSLFIGNLHGMILPLFFDTLFLEDATVEVALSVYCNKS